MSLNYLSVCSGIEALTVAVKGLGWTPVAFSEIEPFPCAVLAHHYPDVPNLGDICKIEGRELNGTVDILVGGTPCQDFSIAGNRGGLDAERSGLAREYIRLLEEIQPRWFIWENVPGTLSSKEGRDYKALLSEMAKCGYGLGARVLDAENFGVNQGRRRLFVVGSLGDWRPASAVLFEPEGLRGDIKTVNRKRKASTKRAGNVSARVYNTDRRQGIVKETDVSHTIKAHLGIDCTSHPIVYKNQTFGTPVEEIETHPTFLANWHKGVKQKTIVYENYRHDCRYGEVDICPTISSHYGTGGGNVPIVYENYSRNADVKEVDVSPPLRAQGSGSLPICLQGNGIRPSANSGCNGKGWRDDGVYYTVTATDRHSIFTNNSLRQLTPIEIERLFGFPDNYTSIPSWTGKKPFPPDSPRYKALGNSMVVPVMRWICERIEKVDRMVNSNIKQGDHNG